MKTKRPPTRAVEAAAQTAATETAAESAATPRPSDPQEIEFLPRREGRTWGAVEVERAVRQLRDWLADEDADAGQRAWDLGDELLELYNGFPERTTDDCRAFVDFARTRLDLSRADVYEFLGIRHRATRTQARELGRRRLSLGFRLMELTGVTTFKTLAGLDLPQPDGSTIRFPAPVRALQAALLLLRVRETPAAPANLAAKARKHNDALDAARADNPVLARVRARFVVQDGKVRLRAGTLDFDEFGALAQLVENLEKGRNTRSR
jgi:hypothetical protein